MATNLNRSDAIYASLRRAILEQALAPGTKLPEDSIGETFGVSRTGVRNAFVRLSSEGLVEMRPNKGAAVATPTLEEAADVFTLRRAIECEIVKRLCERISKETIDALLAHVKEEERALLNPSPRSIRLAGEFHILLAELTQSAYMTDMVSQVVSRSSLILARFGRPHSAECGIDEHYKLIEALKVQDAEAAMLIMRSHLDAVEERAYQEDEVSLPDAASILRKYAESM
ncbi:GntR family transcriptional regulator [Falsihalocynthiibacter arcticus]|uniref:GntR family transcriptional regulator n=1 Tax=Falsihalocynthiibacter arcticus TaxID=1579316 RepID=A0A126UXM0_9RHOB|nr:GntR family transcriptional regulator [Falsihalocynthiibacter arcticus]